ncbi:aromatic amino acid ammonia-lyase [Halorubellus salinus]|uniref:aromatic amino acid ammonia-lyase n=1 Tax=Halorubellus salinus TaxID=755309 RepID=UPI001D05D2E6|nr:aromatic amino acid ammonia-lyase [Halorubellus salinus]
MVTVDGALTVDAVEAVARDGAPVELASEARERMAASKRVVDDVTDANEESVYGVNTGFGNLKDISIDREDLETQQHNLLRSHHAATGDPLPKDVTRAAVLVRANALAVGASGVSVDLVERLLALLDADVLPVVPSDGSADNACELANVGLVLAGDPAGEAIVDGERVSSDAALDAAGLDPYEFGPKEGLALISGTSVQTAQTALAVATLRRVATAADLAGAWTVALVGEEPGAFDDRVFDVRDVDGHRATAANVRALTGEDAPDRADMTQDPLSIRTLPQVNGTLHEHLAMVADPVEQELASATDNPLVFPDGTARSVGHFNGQHLAGLADLLALTTRKVAVASERRSDRLLETAANPHLATDPGLETGLARAQYAAASLVTEMQTLDTASDRSFVASTGQEDVHAAGNLASANLLETVDLTSRVVATELLCAARATTQAGVDLPRPLDVAYSKVDELVGLQLGDVTWSEKIECLAAAVRRGSIVEEVRATGTELH